MVIWAAFLFAASRDVQRDQITVTPGAECVEFLFAASRDVQRDTMIDRLSAELTPFLFAASRDVQRDRLDPNLSTARFSSTVSIRCIARRTA